MCGARHWPAKEIDGNSALLGILVLIYHWKSKEINVNKGTTFTRHSLILKIYSIIILHFFYIVGE